MWLFLPFGFFSIVQANNAELMVRARSRKDLDALIVELQDFDEECRVRFVETPDADYPFRLFVPREPFAAWLGQVALTIDYSNFKNEVAKFDEARAHGAYLEVWSVLRREVDDRTRGLRQAHFRQAHGRGLRRG